MPLRYECFLILMRIAIVAVASTEEPTFAFENNFVLLHTETNDLEIQSPIMLIISSGDPPRW